MTQISAAEVAPAFVASDPVPTFDDVERSAHSHLALLSHEAVQRVLRFLYREAAAHERELSDVFTDFPFLRHYFQALSEHMPDDLSWDEGSAWLRAAIARWEHTDAFLPLRELASTLGLHSDCLLAFVLVGLCEEDAQFGTLFATLQAPLGQRRPTLGLVHELVDSDAARDGYALVAPLLRCGLLEVQNPDAPRAEWVLRVPLSLWGAARGEIELPLQSDRLAYRPSSAFAPIESLLLPDAQRTRLIELARWLSDDRAATVVVRGSAGSERLEVLGALARSHGCGLMVFGDVTTALPIGPLCLLARAMPVFCRDLDHGESLALPTIKGYRGPVGVVLGPMGGLTGDAAEQAIVFVLPTEGALQRALRWQAALTGHDVEDLATIAERFALPPRHLQRAAQLAASYAALDARSRLGVADVREAVRAVNRQSLDVLAARLPEAAGWSQLVVSTDTRGALRRLQRRCEQRERLPAAMGTDFPGGLGRGVRALFEGPSGTGKTLAARVLASELGLDLYRVDLAAVVNKYIGETEKNLGRVLTQAEELDVVLLLDEGDALMGRRTEVRNANDRYANLETNYLLQRLEIYTGIVLVTTNAGAEIDTAFRRRMDASVKFHLPEADERLQLWQLHLPPEHRVRHDQLQQTALRYGLSGGQIRNAAIQATLEALQTSDGCVRAEQVEAAVRGEYGKAGEVFPVERPGAQGPSLAGFLDCISG